MYVKKLAGTYQQSWLTKREITKAKERGKNSFCLQDSFAFTAPLLKIVFRLFSSNFSS